jgi:hypothetical protein
MTGRRRGNVVIKHRFDNRGLWHYEDAGKLVAILSNVALALVPIA